MASDRYAGWIGQIYTESRYTKGITQRGHKGGDKTFVEKVLPVEGVQGYFEYFHILEIDYTFYRLLMALAQFHIDRKTYPKGLGRTGRPGRIRVEFFKSGAKKFENPGKLYT